MILDEFRKKIHLIWSSYAKVINILICFGLKIQDIFKKVTSKAYFLRFTLSNSESLFSLSSTEVYTF